MISYYTSIIILSLLSLGVLSILVFENGRFSKKDKTLLLITYSIVALSAISEWLGIQFSRNTSIPVWALRLVKCADYILTPIAGGALAVQLRTKSILRKLICLVLIINTLFQLIAVFTGWMIVIDSNNHYTHAKLYIVYIILYLILILLVITEFAVYGKHFRRINRKSLVAILFLVISGILMQEIFGGEIRTAYISLVLGLSMLFIHYVEYSQLATDDKIERQVVLITTDTLTGVSSRYAYDRALKKLNAEKSIPKKLAVFSIDINGLKKTNDTLGHEAGDELICGAADCISSIFSSNGVCYRTGGDEFIVISEMNREQANKAITKLTKEAGKWHGKIVKELQLAMGYALYVDHPEMTVEKLIQEADMAMYRDKDTYYQKNGIARRYY